MAKKSKKTETTAPEKNRRDQDPVARSLSEHLVAEMATSGKTASRSGE